MRIAISSSCLTIIILLVIMIHCSIINKNYRDMEINQNINDAFDYAVKKTTSSYNSGLSDFTSTVNNSESVLHNMMLIFNEAFKKSINSDGNFTISVLYADTDNMLIDILITEEYSYGFMNQKGKTSCERTIRFKN